VRKGVKLPEKLTRDGDAARGGGSNCLSMGKEERISRGTGKVGSASRVGKPEGA